MTETPEPDQQSGKGRVLGAIAAVVVLALAALGITGFWAPGFFLGDDGGDGGTNGTAAPTTTTVAPTSEPLQQEEVLLEFIDYVNDGDAAAAVEMGCERNVFVEQSVEDAIDAGAELVVDHQVGDGVGSTENVSFRLSDAANSGALSAAAVELDCIFLFDYAHN